MGANKCPVCCDLGARQSPEWATDGTGEIPLTTVDFAPDFYVHDITEPARQPRCAERLEELTADFRHRITRDRSDAGAVLRWKDSGRVISDQAMRILHRVDLVTDHEVAGTAAAHDEYVRTVT